MTGLYRLQSSLRLFQDWLDSGQLPHSDRLSASITSTRDWALSFTTWTSAFIFSAACVDTLTSWSSFSAFSLATTSSFSFTLSSFCSSSTEDCVSNSLYSPRHILSNSAPGELCSSPCRRFCSWKGRRGRTWGLRVSRVFYKVVVEVPSRELLLHDGISYERISYSSSLANRLETSQIAYTGPSNTNQMCSPFLVLCVRLQRIENIRSVLSLVATSSRPNICCAVIAFGFILISLCGSPQSDMARIRTEIQQGMSG